MTRTVQGKIHGNIIELNENLGIADGQEVEVQVTFIESPTKPKMASGLVAIYDLLGERFDTGDPDLAQRHNEHQP